MDRNTITGLVLIGLILTVFSIINRPTEEDIKKGKDELAKKERLRSEAQKSAVKDTAEMASKPIVSNNTENTSLETISDTTTPPLATIIRDTVIVKETNKFIIHFTNIGGQIQALYLKGYKSYNDYKANKNNSLCLFNKGDHNTSFTFYDGDLRINTAKWDFDFDLFASIDDDFDPYDKYSNIQELSLSELLVLEKKSLGYYLSGHPVNAIKSKISGLRSKEISNLDNDTKKASLVCLINSVRQIKDRKGNPLTFINFDDGTGVMDGVVASDTLESCHSILKEGQILVLKGAIEVDDYKSKEMGDSMFRMRVKEVHSLDIELNRKIKEVTLDIDESNLISLEEFSDKLEKISDFFWKEGTCQLQVKVKANASEAIIEAGKKFKFQPTLENLNYLDDIFGSGALKIN